MFQLLKFNRLYGCCSSQEENIYLTSAKVFGSREALNEYCMKKVKHLTPYILNNYKMFWTNPNSSCKRCGSVYIYDSVDMLDNVHYNVSNINNGDVAKVLNPKKVFKYIANNYLYKEDGYEYIERASELALTLEEKISIINEKQVNKWDIWSTSNDDIRYYVAMNIALLSSNYSEWLNPNTITYYQTLYRKYKIPERVKENKEFMRALYK